MKHGNTKGGGKLGGIPKFGGTVKQGATMSCAKDSSGELGRAKDPNAGKARKKPGNP